MGPDGKHKKRSLILAGGGIKVSFQAGVLQVWLDEAGIEFVHIDAETYIDAVYMTDANIEEAIRRGADELWVIWTVSEKDEWHPGFVATYFQIIETSADGHYRAALKRIAENNAAIGRGEPGE